MTNLTSEQYRDIINHIPNVTEEIPNIQNLLRNAVRTFYKRFGGYPEVAGVAPGSLGIFGDRLKLDDGIVMPVATPMATIVVGRQVPGKYYSIATTSDVGKPHKVSFSFSRKRPLAPGCPKWLNYIKGVIAAFPDTVPPFEAVFETSLPKGDGFGNVPSLEIAFYTFFEILVGKRIDAVEKAKALQRVEAKFGSQKISVADRITATLAKDRQIMLVNCKTNEVLWIPFKTPDVRLIVVDPHLNLGQEFYPQMTMFLKKACDILGVKNLKHYHETDLQDLENKFNEAFHSRIRKKYEQEGELGETESDVWTDKDFVIMSKMVRYYVSELQRVHDAVHACTTGDFKAFGEKLNESHQALREDFDYDNPVFNFLVEASLEVEGVLGSKVTGPGPGFGVVSLVTKDKVKKYCSYISNKFAQYEDQISEELREIIQREKQKQHDLNKGLPSKDLNGDSQKVQDAAAGEGVEERGKRCQDKGVPCIVKVQKQKRCGTWTISEESPKEKNMKKTPKKEVESEEGEAEDEEQLSENSTPTTISEVEKPKLQEPSFYIISPFAGARMMFVTKRDLLRSLYALDLPQPKDLARTAIEVFHDTYKSQVEMISVSPGTANLFGEFMEYHLGCIVCMTLPMYVVTVGGRNDTVHFSVTTTLKEEKNSETTIRYPLPCVRSLDIGSHGWATYVLSAMHEYRDHMPGFDAVVHSSVPIKLGFNSCAAFHSSICMFLESFSKNISQNPLEKIERCHRSELETNPTALELIDRCSSVKYFPIFFCKEGHLTSIDCKKYETSNYYFDDPSYVFLIASCKNNTTDVTLESLEDRLRLCLEAINILGKSSLLNLDVKHLNCLKKREATGEVIKRAKYVITEHQRTLEALEAIKAEDYARVGLLMTQSHASLRDDYEVSSPEIEELILLALNAPGVLGAKMLGKGLSATIIILINLSDIDSCIRYIRQNYRDKSDKPVFYVTKPSGGAFLMDSKVDLPYIP